MGAADVKKLARMLNMSDDTLPLLTEAVTHRTYSVEHGIKYDNQRLEFLGDSVIELINTDYLFHLYPDMNEGDMTKVRSVLACEKTLASFSVLLGFGNYLLIGRGERENCGNERPSTLADLFEAVIGAVYLANGYDAVKKLMMEIYRKNCPDPKKFLLSTNPKGRLQEFSQQHWKCAPQYRVLCSNGPQHDPVFYVEVVLENYTAVGMGKSRKQAEIAAADILCSYFQHHTNLEI